MKILFTHTYTHTHTQTTNISTRRGGNEVLRTTYLDDCWSLEGKKKARHT